MLACPYGAYKIKSEPLPVRISMPLAKHRVSRLCTFPNPLCAQTKRAVSKRQIVGRAAFTPPHSPDPSNPLCSQKNTTLTSGNLVEHRGFEPLTSTMRTLRATNCANAPRMIGGFVQTSVETASRNCTARTQREPSFHMPLIVLICKNYVRTKLAEHIIPRPMGECKGCFCKFIEDCMIFPGKT